MHALTVSGTEGRVCWSYHQAAAIGAWTVSQTEGQWTLTAQVVSVDTFRAAQRPLVFVARSWRWPVLELQMSDGALTARLGPLETPDGTQPHQSPR